MADALGRSAPGITRIEGPNSLVAQLDDLGIPQGHIQADLTMILPKSGYAAKRQGANTWELEYFFDPLQWTNYRKQMKAGQVILLPPSATAVENRYHSASSPVRILTIRVKSDASQLSQPVAIKLANLFEQMNKTSLNQVPAESEILSNPLFETRLLQLKPAAKFQVKSPHSPIYLAVIRGPISLNGKQFEEENIISINAPETSVQIGNPGKKPASVLEVFVLPKS